MKNKSDNKNSILVLIAVLSVTVLIFCIVAICIYSLSEYNSAKDISTLKELVNEDSVSLTDEAISSPDKNTSPAENYSSVLNKYYELYNQNNDLAGWIKIENTRIDYPVMQNLMDEEYYLHRNFDKASSDDGLPFMDTRCILNRPSTNYLIFGHNMKSGNMFADLLKYSDEQFYKDHKIINFDTIYETGTYEIIAVFRTRVAFKDENTFRFYNFIEADDTPEFDDYLENIRNLSLYPIDCEVNNSDKLLTLTTCEYTVDDGRFVVVAKKINDSVK